MLGRARHIDRLTRPLPGYGQLATRQTDGDPLLELALTDANHRRRTGAGTAGQGLTYTALEYPQADLGGVDHLHEADVDPFGKALVPLHDGTQSLHRRISHRRNFNDAVGVAHRDHTTHHSMLLCPQQIGFFRLLSPKRDLARLKLGNPHVDRDLILPFQLQANAATGRADRDAIPVDQPLEAHETGETAGTIAALLHLTAICIEDAIVEVEFRVIGRLHQQQLIKTDPEVAIRQLLDVVISEKHLLGDTIHHHE